MYKVCCNYTSIQPYAYLAWIVGIAPLAAALVMNTAVIATCNQRKQHKLKMRPSIVVYKDNDRRYSHASSRINQ